jgi:ATP-dependent Clp endopeptidase proteolytic subunit ClpP
MTTQLLNLYTAGESATLLLYGDIGGDCDSGRIVNELLALDSQCKKLDVRINSQGGDVFSGIAIYNAIKTSKLDITIYVDGVAASMAAIIALCGRTLMMSPYAKLMLHCVSGGVYGGATAMRQTAQLVEELQGSLAEMVAGRLSITADEVAARYFDGTDHWINAQDALRMGLCDGIYKMEGDAPKPNDDIYTYFNNRLREGAQSQSNMALLESIQALPSFTGMADENAVVAHIQNLANSAVKVDALEQANAALRARIAELEEKEIAAIINQAVADGKIAQEQVASLTKLMHNDREAAVELINSMQPRQQPARAVNYINPDPQAGGLEAKSWDELDRAGKLAELKSANPALFAAKYESKFGVAYKQ